MVGLSSAYAAILRPRRVKARVWVGVGLDRIVVGRASPKRTLFAGQVGEVLQEGAEAVDGLPVFGAPVDGLAARRGRDFGLGDGGRALSGRGIVVFEQHRGEVALH